MRRKTVYRAIEGIDRTQLEQFQAGMRKRYSDEHILEELRAFYRYLARKELIADPAPYQALLGEDAETKLRAVLGERANKGTTTLVADRPVASPKETKASKNKRKAQRKARKKNR